MMPILSLTIKGQIRGGKNNMGVTKSGIHYPHPKFVAWRKYVMDQLSIQVENFTPIDNINYKWQFIYTPEDNRRRDLPAILDAVFHVLEKMKIVVDDCLIKNICFINKPKDKDNAGMEITVYGQD